MIAAQKSLSSIGSLLVRTPFLPLYLFVVDAQGLSESLCVHDSSPHVLMLCGVARCQSVQQTHHLGSFQTGDQSAQPVHRFSCQANVSHSKDRSSISPTGLNTTKTNFDNTDRQDGLSPFSW